MRNVSRSALDSIQVATMLICLGEDPIFSSMELPA